jgi:hypothetical protein
MFRDEDSLALSVCRKMSSSGRREILGFWQAGRNRLIGRIPEYRPERM